MLIIIYIILLLFITYILSVNYVYDKGFNAFNNNKIVLPDLGFNLINNLTNNIWLYNFKEILFGLYILYFIILINNNYKLIKEFIITCGIILIIKNILFTSTILPDPSQKCTLFNLYNFIKGSCYDLIISSHSVLLFVSLLIIINNKLLDFYKLLTCIIVIFIILFLIIGLRQHYTLDIFNSSFYSIFVYYFVSNKIII